MQFAR